VNIARPVFLPYLASSIDHISLQRDPLPFDWYCGGSDPPVLIRDDDDDGDAVLSSDSEYMEVDVEEAAIDQPVPPQGLAAQASNCTQVLATWQVNMDAADVPAVLLPEPVACLILARQWNDMLSVLSWQKHLREKDVISTLLPSWPAAGTAPWRHIGEHRAPPASQDYSAQECLDMANHFRRWSHHVLAAARQQGEGREEIEDSLFD